MAEHEESAPLERQDSADILQAMIEQYESAPLQRQDSADIIQAMTEQMESLPLERQDSADILRATIEFQKAKAGRSGEEKRDKMKEAVAERDAKLQAMNEHKIPEDELFNNLGLESKYDGLSTDLVLKRLQEEGENKLTESSKSASIMANCSVPPMCTVIRDNGIKSKVETSQIVRGDIVLIEAGDSIPADIRILDCNDMKVD